MYYNSVSRHGVLKAGDRVLKINSSDVSQVSQLEALTLLQSSEDTCTLEIEYDVTVHGKQLSISLSLSLSLSL